MRKFALTPLLLATLVLAACGDSHSSAGGPSRGQATAVAATPAPAATAVTGTVELEHPGIAVTPQATLRLSLVDVSQRPAVTVDQQRFSPPSFPQAFRIPFSASAIHPQDLYVLRATMQNAGRAYHTRLQQPVLTHGQPATAKLTLVAAPTAAEQMLAAFERARRQIGGMHVRSGTSRKVGRSQSWQVFSDAHGVQFIIQQVNRGDQGFTKTEYAYRHGRPWVIVREEMPKADAPVTSTARAGWGSNGALVLDQKIQGGKTVALSESAAKALYGRGQAEYHRFSGSP